MAYPTGMLSLTLEEIDRRLVGLKAYLQQVRTEAATSNVPSFRILNLYTRLIQDRAALTTAAAVPGIGTYAQEQKNQPGLNVVTEFNAVIAAVDQVSGWISANFPRDAGGFLLAQTLGASGPEDRTFTPAQTAGLRAQLDSLIATIA